VMATQNPIEQEGTYNLPEAQLDRFMMHVKVDYPSESSEKAILQLIRDENRNLTPPSESISQDDIFKYRDKIYDITMADVVEEYIVQFVLATRKPERYDANLKNWLEYGASPRATIAIDCCARAKAMLDERDYVIPEDVQNVLHDCLRHRLVLSFEAEAAGETADSIINRLIQLVPAN